MRIIKTQIDDQILKNATGKYTTSKHCIRSCLSYKNIKRRDCSALNCVNCIQHFSFLFKTSKKIINQIKKEKNYLKA